MTIQRAIVKATAFDVVQIRNMFTAEVVPSGGDTAQVLWDAYLGVLYGLVTPFMSAGFVTYAVELQNYSAGQWIPFDIVAQDWTGSATGDPLPNAVSLVLIGKGNGLRHMGRKFFGPLTESFNVGNGIATALLGYVADALAGYVVPLTGIGGGTLTPGVVDSAGTFHPFVGGIVSSLLGSMRRRKPGIGI